MGSRAPSLPEVLNTVKDRWFQDLRVAIPARVERYDASKQVIDASPQVKELYEDAEGEQVPLQLPVICDVPLVFPGAGGFHITFPVAVGDTVLLVFSDRSIDAWKSEGGVTSPVDHGRRHHITDAVAIPGLHHGKAPISNPSTSVIEIGKSGESSDFVALSTPTHDEMSALRDNWNTALTALKTHTHTVSGALAASSVALSTLVSPATIGDVASATVKIKG